MALTIIDEPFNWVVRGQKIMLIADSDETAQPGFRYGLAITIDAKTYNFYLAPAPDGNMYFDIAPLVDDLRNEQHHFHYGFGIDDQSKYLLSASITEWWLVAGVLTENEGSEVTMTGRIVINGYYQVYDGYKPNPEVGTDRIKYVLQFSKNYAMSDRLYTTHAWYLSNTWGVGNPTVDNVVWIPSFEDDYGTLSIPGNATFMFNNLVDNMRMVLYKANGTTVNDTIALSGFGIETLGVYPGNLNDWAGINCKPNQTANPDWRFYEVFLRTGTTQSSVKYRFYNAAVYGQKDCLNDKIRLGWVNSRGGWDYFNFIKKSEMTDEIERKKYRKVLFNGTTSVFDKEDRGLFERRNLVQQVLTVTSDYIQEGEFLFLRSLLVSNQVVWLTTDFGGNNIALPVNLDETNYIERKTRDGKQYNVSFKVRMANEYWT
jgi:hypothetical protein